MLVESPTGESGWHALPDSRGGAGVPKSADEAIVAANLLTGESMARAQLAQRETGEPLYLVVSRLGLASEADVTRTLAKAASVPEMDAARFPQEAIRSINLSLPFLRDARLLPVEEHEESVIVAAADPFGRAERDALAFAFGKTVEFRVARASDIDAAIDRLYGNSGSAAESLDGLVDDDDVERLKDLVSDAPVIRAVNRLIAQASDARASDIHVEPAEDRLVVRYRIDGSLTDAGTLPSAMRAPLVSRIKVMAGLNIAERRLPQDGRLRIAVRGREIDLRVATAPSINGESVVMRILDKAKLALDFPSLGFDPELTDQLRDAFQRPHGIVLVTGPTGSGKTTTLYAALSELNAVDRKLLTIEDPIEYRLPGIVQHQANPAIGFDFAGALRSFLRQDPDVIMVGEIRDSETAQIAVQAALTGHMILSTLHTNSAAGAVTRLADMGIERFLLGSVLTGVLAQRLIRRLCTACRAPYRPDPALLEQLGLAPGPGDRFAKATGCPACNHTGYSGRIGLFEFLRVDDTIGHLILEGASTRAISAAASAAGMASLRSDGLAKARSGLTTIEEAVRVAVAD